MSINATGTAGRRVAVAARAAMQLLIAAWSVASCSSPTDAPDPGDPASVTVEPASALLVSVGDTIELAATVRNARSDVIAAAITWSAAPPNIVSVDAQGNVVALRNGTATVRAAAGAVSGTMTAKVEQVVDSLEAAGDMQGGAASLALDSTVAVTVRDARGHPVVDAPVSFSVVTGGGSVDPATTLTDATGSAATTWTLGPEPGMQELDVEAGFAGEVTHRFHASALPLAAASIAAFSGDGQSELAGKALPQPLQVRVLDPAGNGVPDMLVTFAVDGDAALESPQAYTDLDGVATVQLTLGSTPGTYTVQAAVPDSLIRSGEPLDGSPVTMTAEAVSFALAALTGITAGDTISLAGSGFHPMPDSNVVTVGGAPATIVDGTQTQLTIEVPALGCTPQRMLELSVSRDGGAARQAVTWTPANAVVLGVGERTVLTDEQSFCLQFLAGSSDEYLVGLTATGWLDAAATFSMDGLDETGPFPEPAQLARNGLTGVTGASVVRAATSAATSRDPELRLRTYEQEMVARFGSSARARDRLSSSSGSASAGGIAATAGSPPAVGAELALRLPDLRADPCLDYVPVNARVFSVGERLVLATSAALPDPSGALFASLSAAADALHATFGDVAVDLIAAFLGAPDDWSADSRVTIVLIPEVSLMGVPAFATAVDRFPRSACPSSNEGYYVYAGVPEAATLAQLVTTLNESPPDLAHQIAHLVQWTRRLSAGGNLLPSWMAEGQAELIVEHVGLRLAGLGPRQELGAAVLGMPGVSEWIAERFDRLARFHGWDGASGRIDGAPQGCSLFGFGGVCDPAAAPGAAWSFLRYLSDRFGSAGGASALHDAILDMEPTADLLAQLEELLGITLPALIVDWAGMLYADGRLPAAAAPALQMTSWRLEEMIAAGPKRLAPESFGFTAFSRAGTIVGGGTAYSLISSAGDHGSLAVSVDNGAGGAIAPLLRPRLWVLRMR